MTCHPLPSIPTADPRVGQVERTVLTLPPLEQAMRAADDAVGRCTGRKAERRRLIGLSDEATRAFYDAEDAAMAAEPETVLDALLIIALAATAARTVTEGGVDEAVSAWLQGAACRSRRAADFIATSIGRDLSALLPSDHNFPMEVSS